MLTMFSTPKPFRGYIAVIQRNALESWKRLHPDVEVILFGKDEGTAEICRELGLRHEPEVVLSERGTKRLDCIFGRAQEIAGHDFVCYANCDIILTLAFLESIERLRAWRPEFLMVGRRWDTDVTERIDFSAPDWQERIVARAKSEGIQRFYHNIDYFAFPRWLYREIPPLVIGRIWWDHWLVWQARQLGAVIVDASDVVCAVHQNHDYAYHPQGVVGVSDDEEACRNLELLGGRRHSRTIEDADYRLTAIGIRPNWLYWLAPAKRRCRETERRTRNLLRTGLWHPFLDMTRPLRHAVGLKQDIISAPFRRRQRRHWMDQ